MEEKDIEVAAGKDSVQIVQGRWTDVRLQNLFSHYNRRFWKGKLRAFDVVLDDSMTHCWGEIDFDTKRIRIKTAGQSDRKVRSTVLHEMAHLAARRPGGHNSAFFEQLENLLRQKAPLLMDMPENQNRPILESAPKRFKRCRSALNHAYRRWHRSMERELSKLENVPGESLESAIIRDFEGAGIDDVKWAAARALIGDEYGLLDIDGKPLGPKEEQLINKGKRVFRRKRDSLLERRRLKKKRAEFDSQQSDDKIKS
jgi:hypothetical protein